MSKEREALELTLVALKQIDAAMPFPVAKLAIMKAEEVLEQPAPVLTGIDCSCGRKWRVVNNTLTATEQPEYQSTADKSKLEKVPAKGTLLAQPEQFCGFDVVLDESMPPNTFKLAQPEQEPVAWANPHDLQNFDMKVRTSGGPLHTVPLYTTPPQRTWVGLTPEEILKEIPVTGHIPITSFARALEAKLKEKNT